MSPSTTTNRIIKFNFNSDIRKFEISIANFTFDEMDKIFRKKYDVKKSTLRFKYIDSDKDLVSLFNDEDVRLALMEEKLTVLVSCESGSPADQTDSNTSQLGDNSMKEHIQQAVEKQRSSSAHYEAEGTSEYSGNDSQRRKGSAHHSNDAEVDQSARSPIVYGQGLNEDSWPDDSIVSSVKRTLAQANRLQNVLGSLSSVQPVESERSSDSDEVMSETVPSHRESQSSCASSPTTCGKKSESPETNKTTPDAEDKHVSSNNTSKNSESSRTETLVGQEKRSSSPMDQDQSIMESHRRHPGSEYRTPEKEQSPRISSRSLVLTLKPHTLRQVPKRRIVDRDEVRDGPSRSDQREDGELPSSSPQEENTRSRGSSRDVRHQEALVRNLERNRGDRSLDSENRRQFKRRNRDEAFRRSDGNRDSRNVNPHNIGSHNAESHHTNLRDMGPRNADPRNAYPRNVDPRNVDPRNVDPRNVDPRNAYPRNVDPRNVDPRNVDPRNAYPHNADPRNAYPRNADPRAADSHHGARHSRGHDDFNDNSKRRRLDRRTSR